MIHKLIPVRHKDYNTLQVIIKHEVHENEEETGYYMMVSLCKIVEGKYPSIKQHKTHGRQLIKKAKAENSYDDKDLKNIIKSYRASFNAIFDLSLLDRDL